MNSILWGLIASLTPFLELRAGLPILVFGGIPVFWAFLLSVLFNLAVFPITYLFLNYVHHHLRKFRYYENVFRHFEEKYKKKIEHRVGTKWEYLALFAFVVVPLPGTGAYSGSFIAWLFGLDKWKSFLAVSAGVVGAGILVALAVVGAVRLF